MPRVDRHSFKLRNPSYNPHLGIRGLVVMTSLGNNAPNKAFASGCIIRHDAIFKAAWDWFILILVIYTAIEIPYSAAFLLPEQIRAKTSINDRFGSLLAGSPLAVCNLCVDLMFIIDIPINFRSTYINEETDELVTHPKRIAWHYFKSWFVIDLLSAIPFEFMIDTDKKGATTLMGLLKTARLLRLVRVVRTLDRYSEYGQAVIILLTCLFLLVAHWLACIWHAIGDNQTSSDGWVARLSKHIAEAESNTTVVMSPSVETRYITALYFTMTSLSSVGFGNVSPNTNAEKLFSICVMIVGALMYASIFGNMTAIIQRLYSQTSRHHRNLRVLRDFIRFYNIPSNLRDDLEEYFRHEWSYTKGVDIDTVLKRFPDSLQADICVHLHKKLFAECTAFRGASEGCLRALAKRFDIKRLLPGQYLIKQGDEVKNLYFIAKGFVEVIGDDKILLVLGKGDVISCEYNSLIQSAKANASLLVQTYCQIHVVAWQDLLAVLKVYPDFGELFTNHLKLAYNLGNFEDDYVNLAADACPLDANDIEMQPLLNKVPNCTTKTPDQLSSLENKLDKLEEKMEYIEKKLTDTLNKIIPMLKRIAAGTNSTKPKQDRTETSVIM